MRWDLMIAMFGIGFRINADINHSANALAMKREHVCFDVGFMHMHRSRTLLWHEGVPAGLGSFPGSFPYLAEEWAEDRD